jgi:glycosyltransferase involved in cell wall biosynthesis
MRPFVSILIPAFNSAESIANTIQSAKEQTWPGKEIIVVDDGSTDQTVSIAQKFASKNVLVVTQSNQGASTARNKAYSLSQGDYVQWLDADDLLAPDKISKQIAALENSGSERTLLSSAWGRFMFRVDRAEFSPTLLWENLSPVEWFVRKLKYNLYMQTGSWLVSRQLTETAGHWDTRLSTDDDGEYFSRVILACDLVQFVPEARMFYRQANADRLSIIARSNRKLESQLLSMKLQIGYLLSLEKSERVREACIRFLQEWMIYFYPERPDLVSELEQLAAEVGGKLEVPMLSWKYAWIQKLFGWSAAKQAQIRYNRYKTGALRLWDKALFNLQSGGVRRWEAAGIEVR